MPTSDESIVIVSYMHVWSLLQTSCTVWLTVVMSKYKGTKVKSVYVAEFQPERYQRIDSLAFILPAR